MADRILMVLPWVLPPVLGAVIGYVTNAIAIKMLFRPLVAKHILGLRIPFTPGIIPRQRHDLAESIGNMVSRELVNEGTLRRQIETEEFRQSVSASISSFSQKFLDTPIGSLRPEKEDILYRGMERFVARTLHRFFRSEGFFDGIDRILSVGIRNIFRHPLSLLYPENLDEVLQDAVRGLSRGKAKEEIRAALSDFLVQQARQDRPVRDLLPQDFLHDVDGYLRKMYPKLLDGVLRWMNEKSTRVELEIRGRFLLRDILNKMTAIQRMIVNAGQYSQRLSERMPEIINDVIRSVEVSGSKPENIRRIIISVERFIRRWLQKSAGEIASELGVDLEQKIPRIIDRLFEYIENPETAALVASKIHGFLERNGDAVIGDVSRSVLGVDEQQLKNFLLQKIRLYFRASRNTADLPGSIVQVVSDFLESRQEVPVQDLIGIGEPMKRDIDGFITDRVLQLIDAKLPEMLASFNVKKLVVEKIDSLDVAQVESLLLMVIARHLKWINLFGAFLGALIGMIQIVVNSFV